MWPVWLLVLLLPALATASEIDHRPFSLQLEGGGIQPALNDSAQIWAFRPFLGGSLQYMISDHTGLILSGMLTSIYDDTTNTSLFQTNKGDADRKWVIRSFSLGTKLYVQRRGGAAPFLLTTIDLLRWRVEDLPDGDYVQVEDGAGNRTTYEATELGATVGLGVEQLLGERLGLSATVSFTYLTGIGVDLADWVEDSRSRALLRLSASLSFNFGLGGRSLRERLTENDQARIDEVSRRAYSEEATDTEVDSVMTETEEEFTPVERGYPPPDMDADLDGIADRQDKCPGTPEGALVDSSGCPNDSDGDGVYDGIDRCTDTPKEAHSSVTEEGCSHDRDFDGVPDYIDKCPNTPPPAKVDSLGCVPDTDGDGVEDDFDACAETPAGLAVDARGCPDFKAIFARRIVGALFRPGGTELIEERCAVLDSVVHLLYIFPEVTAVVKGYTDNIGPAEANVELSGKRARAVMRYLNERGVAATRLKAVGLGETNFIASNRTKPGREQNRRVEIEFSYPDR